MASRMRYTGLVAGVEEVRTRHSASAVLRLRDIVDADGLPFRGVPYLMIGAQVRRLDLRPGEAITFVAHIAALDAEGYSMGDGGCAPERLARPAKLARAGSQRATSRRAATPALPMPR